ncbi:MAG: undecaprenyldiphospho-muramoylpentapeptide beta-N-acetylglucosaminyltransferase [Acidobacteria bacterium]|nr:undecaprenyldiphospho-muramoylpentapeptide beta-N-acetylglucosaminyltransferase [Acidobacteriota bacterium]
MGGRGPWRLLIAGGGTGGHIFIGIALAQEWKSRMEGNEVLFVGARGRLEETLVAQRGIPLQLLDVSQLKGVSRLRQVRNLLKLPASLFHCIQMIRVFRPHAAIGVGGYASGPAILAAGLQRIPTMVVEPNVKPGITNRWLSRTIRLAAVAFPETQRYFGAKARITGIPVRKEFFLVSPVMSQDFTLLVFGGSQGSRAVNAAVAEAIPLLKAEIPNLKVIHQTGAAEYESYRHYQSDWWSVRPFIDEMAQAMALARVVVCRAGASTIAELAAAGKCALLIPFPFATDNHQTMNAQSLKAKGAARLLPQSELSGATLFQHIIDLYQHPEERRVMETAIRQFSAPGSAEMIIDLALSLIDGGAN